MTVERMLNVLVDDETNVVFRVFENDDLIVQRDFQNGSETIDSGLYQENKRSLVKAARYTNGSAKCQYRTLTIEFDIGQVRC